MSKTGYGSIGAGIGALAGAIVGNEVWFEYGWIAAGLGALIGVYAGYWLADRRGHHHS